VPSSEPKYIHFPSHWEPIPVKWLQELIV
jgi:hypothetical protein